MTEQSDDEQHLTDENDVLEDNKSSTLYINGNGMLVEDSAGKHPGVNIKFAFDNSALNKKSLPVNQLYLVFVVFVVEFTLFHTFIIFHMFI